MIKFLALGGADEIGASCFYLNISGTGILLDCGIHPRKIGIEALPYFDLLNDLPLDFVFISHAHQDHIGSLPYLIQQFPHVIIYSTPQTKEIAELTLHNAANILSHNQSQPDNVNFYSHEEIDLLVKSMNGIVYRETLSITGMRHNSTDSIKVTFYDAGHILGAAVILIESAEGKILYTGDINLSHQSIVVGADLSSAKQLDTLILESTYGAIDSAKLGTWGSEEKRFAKSANKILNVGGSILIPVFALGKTQEILSSIHKLMKKSVLTEINIYTGGIGRQISNIYDRSKYITRRTSTKIEFKEIEQFNLLEIEDYNHFKKNPGIVLASSGMMLEGTTSHKLLDYWLKQENFAIYSVGYMDPETPGYRVANSKKGEEIKLNDLIPIKRVHCEIDRFYFSSHAKREELLKIVQLTNPKRVILVHGDYDSKNWLGHQILINYSHVKVHSSENGKWIEF